MSNSESKASEYPPNPHQWPFERHGIQLRSRLGIAPDKALDAKAAYEEFGEKLFVIPEKYLEGCDAEDYETAVVRGANQWSAVTILFDGGRWGVLLNPRNSEKRRRATLMEELFHVVLGHTPTAVFRDPASGMFRREFQAEIETEAYHSGACALVPYSPLKEMLEAKKAMSDIADHFNVTLDLVRMRAKVCRLWKRYQHLDSNEA